MHYFFFQAEDGIRDTSVTGVQTCALPISMRAAGRSPSMARTAPSGPTMCSTTSSPAAASSAKIGRASCRERVSIPVVGGSLKKKKWGEMHGVGKQHEKVQM